MTASPSTRRRLTDIFVVAVMPLVVVASVWYTNERTSDAVQDATAKSLLQVQRASCENSNEFRSFMSGYLRSEIGMPISDITGFDQLEPPVRDLVLSLAPVLDAGRANRVTKSITYDNDFPIMDCSKFDPSPPPTTSGG